MGLLEDVVTAAKAYRLRPRPTETTLFVTPWQKAILDEDPERAQATADEIARSFGLPTPVRITVYGGDDV